MNLFIQLLNEVDNPDTTVSAILLKARRLAAELPGRKFRSWVLAEMNGYRETNIDVPSYRVIQVQSRGEFIGACIAKNVLLPTYHLPSELRGELERHPFLDSVGTLEGYLRIEGEKLASPWPDAVVSYYRTNPGVGISWSTLTEAHKVLPKPAIEGILYAVRTRLLEFLIQLGEERPELKKAGGDASRITAENVEALFDRVILQNCTIGGNVAVGDKEIHVGGDIQVSGDFVVADAIENSFNKVASSVAPDEVKSTLRQLAVAVKEMGEELPEEKKKEAVQAFDTLSTEVAKGEPRKNWLKIAGEELAALGKAVGQTAVSGLVTAILHHYGL